jgi:hypothetical protein
MPIVIVQQQRGGRWTTHVSVSYIDDTLALGSALGFDHLRVADAASTASHARLRVVVVLFACMAARKLLAAAQKQE